MRESKIEKALTAEVKRIGGYCFKLVPTLEKGLPDRLVLFQGRTYFIELKNEKGVISTKQKEMILKLQADGQKVEIINSLEAINNFIKSINVDRKLK